MINLFNIFKLLLKVMVQTDSEIVGGFCSPRPTFKFIPNSYVKKKYNFINEDDDNDDDELEQDEKYYINVSYKRRNEYREKYGYKNVRWDNDKKSWYWLGQKSKMPDGISSILK